MRPGFKRGHVFKETYRLEKELGGTKIAYKVSHQTLKTAYVVEQVMDLSLVEEMEYDQRQEARREFAALQDKLKSYAGLSHPGLARVIDSFELEERHYLVREWVEGYTLRTLLEQSLKPLEQDTTLDFAGQLLGLLEDLSNHQPPLVLGTLCPDYIVVTPEGRLKVIDFGLSSHSKGKTDFEAFSCPELLGGSELDQRADLYSLGAILYFCFTGMELPPIWDRITYQDAIPSPLELNVKVSAPVWASLESMLSLNLAARPESVEEVRALLKSEEFEETPESSPATWYPEQSDLMLGDSYPFAPIEKDDWILKMVQASVVGRARTLAVVQNREACCLDLRMAATDVPTPRSVLEALTTDAPVANPTVLPLAAGLRTIGEFRPFKLTLDDWKQSWTLTCKGGRISTESGPSFGRSGVYVQVKYTGKSMDRARQSAEELVRLTRRTRLCTVPITIGKKPLEPGRGVEISELPKSVVELYLASASLPEVGSAKLVAEPGETGEEALTVFAPPEGREKFSHIDVRCYVAPGEGAVSDILHTGYHFLRRPSRVLWYRHGVLCGQQQLGKKFPLQLDIHLNGDHLETDNSGLKLRLAEWLQPSRLKPMHEVARILELVRLKLVEHWQENPGEAAPRAQALAGMMGAPLFLFFLANAVSPGLLFLKTAAVSALAKASAAFGGTAGYLTATDHLDAVRKTCLKAIEAFLKEEL